MTFSFEKKTNQLKEYNTQIFLLALKTTESLTLLAEGCDIRLYKVRVGYLQLVNICIRTSKLYRLSAAEGEEVRTQSIWHVEGSFSTFEHGLKNQWRILL
jgi:hypothetical protein